MIKFIKKLFKIEDIEKYNRESFLKRKFDLISRLGLRVGFEDYYSQLNIGFRVPIKFKGHIFSHFKSECYRNECGLQYNSTLTLDINVNSYNIDEIITIVDSLRLYNIKSNINAIDDLTDIYEPDSTRLVKLNKSSNGNFLMEYLIKDDILGNLTLIVKSCDRMGVLNGNYDKIYFQYYD